MLIHDFFPQLLKRLVFFSTIIFTLQAKYRYFLLFVLKSHKEFQQKLSAVNYSFKVVLAFFLDFNFFYNLKFLSLCTQTFTESLQISFLQKLDFCAGTNVLFFILRFLCSLVTKYFYNSSYRVVFQLNVPGKEISCRP